MLGDGDPKVKRESDQHRLRRPDEQGERRDGKLHRHGERRECACDPSCHWRVVQPPCSWQARQELSAEDRRAAVLDVEEIAIDLEQRCAGVQDVAHGAQRRGHLDEGHVALCQTRDAPAREHVHCGKRQKYEPPCAVPYTRHLAQLNGR